MDRHPWRLYPGNESAGDGSSLNIYNNLDSVNLDTIERFAMGPLHPGEEELFDDLYSNIRPDTIDTAHRIAAERMHRREMGGDWGFGASDGLTYYIEDMFTNDDWGYGFWEDDCW